MASQATSTGFSFESISERYALRDRQLLLHFSIFVLAFFLVFLRRPDAILNAQFYAEDGKYWFAEAYNLGWRCLLVPVGGYLNSLSRLIGMFSLLFPLLRAPLVMNICALSVEVLPVNVFLSSRFNAIPFNTRLLASALYLALPNSFEIHATTTNIQWHLALVGLLLLLGHQDRRLAWRVFEFLVLAVAVLDGPLGILLVPIAGLLRLIRKDQRYNLALMAMIPPALLQLAVLAMSNSRQTAPNGATFKLFTSIVGGQVFFSSVLGVRSSIQLAFENGAHYFFPFALVAFAVGSFFVVYALRYAPLELKLFYLFAGTVLALALKHPLASFAGNLQQWELMEVPGYCNRYYFFPMLAFLATPVWMLSSSTVKSRLPRCAALLIVLLLPIGICRDWQVKPFPDMNFKAYAAQFERAAPGTQMTIPIHPKWKMELTKR